MSAVKAIRYLLANNAGLIAVVPAARISAGRLPQGVTIPAIEINQVSAVWNSEVSAQGKFCRARVQVTAMALTYVQQRQIMALIRAAVPRTRGTINSVSVDSILRDIEGPDFMLEDTSIFLQSQDFIVQFTE